MVRYYNGVANTEEERKAHKLEFYKILDNAHQKKNATSTLITLERWNAILHICKHIGMVLANVTLSFCRRI